MILGIDLLANSAQFQTAQPAAARAETPWLLIALAATIIVAAALAGWLTWRDVMQRTALSPEPISPVAAPAAQSSAGLPANALSQVGPPQQITPPTARAAGRFQLAGISGALAGTVIAVDDECLISRGPVRWAVIPDSAVSAPHAALDLTREPPRIKDLGSRNGVRLDQKTLGSSFVDLAAGQAIGVGSLSFSLDGEALRVTRGALQGKAFALAQAFVILSRRELPVHVTGDADPGLSDAHALLVIDGDRLTIKDLNSSNGTLVNQARIGNAESTPLQPGDIVQLGRSTFKVQASR